MAEAHPVGFQWVMEAKQRGAKVIHVDPRFTRTSALADLHVPLRAGSDIAFLGGLINYVLTNEAHFLDYVRTYTNAALIVGEEFRDTEDLHGVFSGFDTETASYDTSSWQYADGQQRPREAETSPSKEHGRERETSRPERAGSGGPSYSGTAHTDPTLQHPRCVFQILKRHYARYTPEMVEQVCGVPRELFQQVAETLVRATTGRWRSLAGGPFLVASEILLETDPPMAADVDGEVALRTPLRIKVIPNGVRVMVPQDFVDS